MVYKVHIKFGYNKKLSKIQLYGISIKIIGPLKENYMTSRSLFQNILVVVIGSNIPKDRI